MFRSIRPCPLVRFLIPPARSCRKTGPTSPRIEGESALAIKISQHIFHCARAALCRRTGFTPSLSLHGDKTVGSKWPACFLRAASLYRPPFLQGRRLQIAFYPPDEFSELKPHTVSQKPASSVASRCRPWRSGPIASFWRRSNSDTRPRMARGRHRSRRPKVSMRRRIAATLSCGDHGALGPPMSVLTHPGLSNTQVMPRGAKSIAALRITIFTAVLELR
jgi:hypothetical protein